MGQLQKVELLPPGNEEFYTGPQDADRPAENELSSLYAEAYREIHEAVQRRDRPMAAFQLRDEEVLDAVEDFAFVPADEGAENAENAKQNK